MIVFGALVFASLINSSVVALAEQDEIEAFKSELQSIRQELEQQGKMIRALYEFANRELNLQERQKEAKTDNKLALDRIWESSGAGFTERAEFSPRDLTFAAITTDGGVSIHDTTGKLIQKLTTPESVTKTIAYSPDGSRLLAGTEDGQLLLWDLKSSQSRAITRRHYLIDRVAWLGKTGRVVIQSALGSTVKDLKTGESSNVQGEVLELANGNPIWTFTAWQHLDYQNLATAPNGQWLAVLKIRNERGAFGLDAQTGNITGTSIRIGNSGLSVAIAPDSRTVAVGTPGVFLWDTSTRKMTRHLQGHENWVVSLAFAPDGKLLISGSGDSTARIWEIETGEELGRIRFPGPSTYVHSVSFSFDGKLVLAGAENGHLIIGKLPLPPSTQ